MTDGPAADPPLFRLLNEIAIIAQLSAAAFEATMPAGMTLAQFTALNHLARLGDGRAPSRIAAALQVTKATMTSTLGRLSAKGLVTLEDDPADGRAKLVRLTPAGRAMRQNCVTGLAPALDHLAATLDAARIAALLPELAALRRALDGMRG